ncbi:uncharacterized protein LOC129251645 [Anastrepha obliqua]|uniref:uncharacterized protein LOC128866972 n=1 Tax=Anastrepha ludens TaxID=28586 RepID=UPI0023AF8CDD|nr:uncharacterized protein LOC128866972 [Anastrepha ludens]XP_054746823.1 uncharacterized protein LOC129251645 [Anastrepha obliqua]
MKSIIAPEVDMLTVSKSSRNQRKSILNFAPKMDLVNYSKSDNIDNFYLECQNFRDYYRDPYCKLSKPEAFKVPYGKCGRQIDRNSVLSLPVTWVREYHPVIYALQYGRELHLDEGISLGGQYDPTSCIKYKR